MNNFLESQLKANKELFHLTKTVRFQAHQKFRKYNFFSVISLNFCSATLILMSMVPKFNLLRPESNGFFDFWNLGCSLYILVIGLIITAYDFRQISNDYLNSGNRINDLYNNLKALESKYKNLVQNNMITFESEKEITDNLNIQIKKYRNILKTSLNHSDEDFAYTVLKRGPKFSDHYLYYYKRKCSYLINYHFPNIIIILLMLTFLIMPFLTFINFTKIKDLFFSTF